MTEAAGYQAEYGESGDSGRQFAEVVTDFDGHGVPDTVQISQMLVNQELIGQLMVNYNQVEITFDGTVWDEDFSGTVTMDLYMGRRIQLDVEDGCISNTHEVDMMRLRKPDEQNVRPVQRITYGLHEDRSRELIGTYQQITNILDDPEINHALNAAIETFRANSPDGEI